MPSPAARSRTSRASEHAPPLTIAGRPLELALALLIALAASLVGVLLDILPAVGFAIPGVPADARLSQNPVGAVAVAVFALLVVLGLCFLAWRGANWVRILLIVLSVPSVLAAPYRAAIGERPPAEMIASAVVGTAIIVLLLLPRVHAWMRAQA